MPKSSFTRVPTGAPLNALLAFMVVSLCLYGLHGWEWGFMDDLSLVNHARDCVARDGLLRGMLATLADHYRTDASSGLFRPSYWIYESTVYLLSPSLAHWLRFVIFLGIVGLSLSIAAEARRAAGREARPRRRFLALVAASVLAIHPLYDCLSFVSLQEYPGLLLVLAAIRLSMTGRPTGVKEAGSIACLCAAAWFKTPFVWTLAAFGALLVFAKPRRLAAGGAALAAALATLVVSAVWAASGSYTGAFLRSDIWAWFRTIWHFLEFAAAPVFILLLSLGAGRVRGRAPADGLGLVLFAGGALYVANLLPWGSPQYHFGAPTLLVVLGAFVMLAPRYRPPTAGKIGELAVALAVALVVGGHGLWKVGARELTMDRLRDWALGLPRAGLTVATNGSESAVQLRQLLRLRSNGRWRNTVVTLDDNEPRAVAVDYYVVLSDQGSGNAAVIGSAARKVARFPLADVYELH